MQQPLNDLLTIKPQTLDKDFVCRQILEFVDMARVQNNAVLGLEGMSMIAAIQNMFDDHADD